MKVRKSLSALTVSAAIFLTPAVLVPTSVVVLSPTSAVASDWCGPNSDEGTCGTGPSWWDYVMCSIGFWRTGNLNCP
jgi:hypothetical protein